MSIYCYFVVGVLCFCCICIHLLTADFDDDVNQNPLMILEHEVSSGVFAQRGTISVRYIGGAAFYHQEAPLSDEAIDYYYSLLRSSGIYRVRVLINAAKKDNYVYGFAYACDLLASKLHDNLTLSVNAQGQLIGVHITSHRAPKLDDCQAADVVPIDQIPRIFNSFVIVNKPEQNPIPETQLFIKRMEDEKRRRQETDSGDNKSFFSKYWMYIVPGVVVLFLAANQGDPNAGAS